MDRAKHFGCVGRFSGTGGPEEFIIKSPRRTPTYLMSAAKLMRPATCRLRRSLTAPVNLVLSFLLQSVKRLLKNLPILQPFHLFHCSGIEFGFPRVFRRPMDAIKDSEIAWEWCIGQFVCRHLVSDIVIGRHCVEYATFAWVGCIEGAFVELDALT